MTDLPQWLQEWFAENEPGYRGRGIQLVLWLKPVDALPDRPGRKRTADARVTAEAGDRWVNYAVHEQGWASILAMGNESDPVWQAHLRPSHRGDVDGVLGQTLAWVESASEVPNWAES
ncbi:hypothetical protein ABZ891_13435 [Streptomyces sp. NPDC047023]|uniref:hypothetical protein n=1 Tax=Streptomyces sp. NPDC047023 TaxID=3155139 RepID=UPI0033EAAA2F